MKKYIIYNKIKLFFCISLIYSLLWLRRSYFHSEMQKKSLIFFCISLIYS